MRSGEAMDPGIQVLSTELMEAVADEARRSSRQRTNFNFHAGASDPVHRFLNVLLRGTYVQPHRHLNPPKHESFIVLKGAVAVLVFDDTGTVERVQRLDCSGPVMGIDLPAGVWHTIVVLSEEAVCYEVKPGPWDPATDKEFASWAPPESEPALAAAYLHTLLARVPER